MSRRRYADGALLEEWDDTTGTYRRYRDGNVVEERPYTDAEVGAQTVGAEQVRRAELEQAARDAIAGNDADLAQDNAVHAAALGIVNNEAATATPEQLVTVVKQLAQGIAILVEHDARTKQQLNALIRLAVGG